MRGHAISDLLERKRALEEHKQEIQGRLPKGPYEFSENLDFDDFEVTEADPPVVRRFKLAIKRDARHGAAGGVYLRVFGLSQGLRSIYDGGGQLQDGGAS
tara:strand:- start:823 stop:1122 length:300 start_codon:yes stop_codon:yes gene_type:complete